MKVLHSIPAMPVSDMKRGTAFYQDQLGFALGHHEDGFAILRRDGVELHLWAATDQSWRTRAGGSASPVVSGAESFIAGTASCRVEVAGVDELHQAIQPRGIIHPNAPLRDTDWGTREFGVLDPDGNGITFYERTRSRS